MQVIPKNRPWTRIAWRAAIVLLLVGIAGLVLIRTLPEAGLQRQVRAIRETGLPVSSADLNKWYREVPTAENGALLVWEAAEEHVSPGNALDGMSLPLAGGTTDPELAAEIAEHLAKNKTVLEKLHAATKHATNRYPIDFTEKPDTLLPHLAKIKGLAQLLRYEAVSEAAEGNRERAVSAVIAGFWLAHSLRDEPTLISQLVRIACVAIALDSMEKIVSAHPLSDLELRTLSHKLMEAEADGITGTYRAFAGDRAGAISFMTSGQPYYWEEVGGSTNSTMVLQKLKWGFQRILGLQRRDLNLYLEAAGDFVQVATNGFPGAMQRSDEVKRAMDKKLNSALGRFAVITQTTVSSWNGVISKVAAINTQLRCARVALAVERFRAANNGRLPQQLDELVPKYISELPGDTVDGEPLKFLTRPPVGYYISSPNAAATLKNKRQTSFGVYR